MQEQAQRIHEKALQIASVYRRCEAQLIEILQEIDRHQVFLLLGYASLFQYAISEMKLSEPSALNFIAVARKAREIPEIKKALEKGQVTVSKVRKITSIVTRQNAQEWLQKAADLSQKELEREVARVQPKPEPFVFAQAISFNRMALQLGISEDLMQKLVRIQDLLSQRRKKPVPLEEALEVMAEEFLHKHDPLAKAQRAIDRKEAKASRPEEKVNLPDQHVLRHEPLERNDEEDERLDLDELEETVSREAFDNFIKHQVIHRDRLQCTFIHANGKRCGQRRWLQIHHILPVAQGGKNRLENLRLLCSAHHKLAHYDLALKGKHEHTPRQIPMGI